MRNKFGVCDLVKITEGRYSGKYGIVIDAPLTWILSSKKSSYAHVKLVKCVPDWYRKTNQVDNTAYIQVQQMQVIKKRWRKKGKAIWGSNNQNLISLAIFTSIYFSYLPIIDFNAGLFFGIFLTLMYMVIGKVIYDDL